MPVRRKKQPVKVGIWGLGRAGNNMHAVEIARFPDEFEVVAGCDLDMKRVKVLQSKFPKAKGYVDGDRFLADPDIELVSVAVRSAQHVDYCLRALEAGKIVFLEKPIAISMKGLKRLQEAVKAYPGRVFFRQNRRFEPCLNHIREIIRSGILGDVYEIKLCRHSFDFRADWQTLRKCGGGQLNNWGPHLIDHALRLLESPVESVWSDLKNIASLGDAEDHLKVLFRGTNGRIIDLEISGGVALPGPVYAIYGTRGALVSRDGNDIQLKYLSGNVKKTSSGAHEDNPPLSGWFQDAIRPQWIRETVMADPDPANEYGLENQDIYHHLYSAIREGKPFPITAEEAFEVVKTTLLIKRQNPAFKGIEDEFGK